MKKINILDKTIAKISPQFALNREVAKQKLEFVNSGYSDHGASKRKNNFLGWRFGSGGPDEDIIENIVDLRERSRDLFMGTPVACGAIKKFRANVVGAGLIPKPVIDNDFLGISREEAVKIEKTIKREFDYWANSTNADSMRLHTFYTLQSLATLSWAMNGDVFAIPTLKKRSGVRSRLSIKLIEADRVTNPFNVGSRDIKGGVELNDSGEVIAYHVADKHPGDNYTVKTERITAFGSTGRRNILHMLEPERVGQRRGVPVLAPVIESLLQLGRYSKAELNAAVISGIFGTFIKRGLDNEDNFGTLSDVDDENKVLDRDSSKVEMSSNNIQMLSEGDDIVTVNPTRPNANYKAFVDSIIEEIGTALEIPRDILMSRFDSSYSASRAALEEAWKRFIAVRKMMKDYFNQPIYEEFILELVADGKIKAPGFFENEMKRSAYCKAMWVGPKKGTLDPFKEVKAAELRVSNNFTTREIECQEYGHDFDEIVKQRGNEEDKIRELNINGVEVGGLSNG